MINAEHLSKRYRKKVAVEDLSFTVKPGRVTGFLGPNGSGKSTTMRLMLGLDRGEGDTTFDGKHLHEYVHSSRIVGVLLEAKAFHPTRTARDHLRVLADAGDIPLQRVDEALDLVGIRSEQSRPPGKFSLGMSQRLGIAAAILGEPKYLVLDEPANGLDPEGIAWLRKFIRYYADKGNAVFVSSHLLSEMSQMADDVVVIGKGKMIANASINDLITRSGHVSVYVRAEKTGALVRALRKRKLAHTAAGRGVEVTGASTDEIGKLAFAAGIPVLELSCRNASLEEAFLELTENTQEFRAQDTPKKGRRT